MPGSASLLVHQIFEEQVRKAPNAIAVAHNESRLTYAQLNSRANRVAHYLQRRGVGPDQVVGMCIDRCPEMIIGLLAILKAGGAYLPLDPAYPLKRLQHMLADAAPSLVIVDEPHQERLRAAGAEVLALKAIVREAESFDDRNPAGVEHDGTSQNLVYVIYTSGSTGRPKGVAMTHHSMVNLVEWCGANVGIDVGRSVLQFAALSFDVAFQETFATLCNGGTLALLDEWTRKDAQALMELLEKLSIQTLFIPPLMLQSLAQHCKSVGAKMPSELKDVITAGEQLRISSEVLSLFVSLGGCRLHNHYGPTETHVVSSFSLMGNPAAWPTLPPIGRPIPNTELYVLDERLRPVLEGGVGEIYVAGAGVARGYLRQSALTAERFIANPYSDEATGRMYKTGDQGRWLPEGTLEYVGRIDSQVKIRGYRIELGEIEAQLAYHPHVRESAVVARESELGERRLVAYVTLRDQCHLEIDELRSHLKSALPEFMVPSAFAILDHFPLTAIGKLDRQALPSPDIDAFRRSYIPPQGKAEQTLASIWRDLLGIEQVGREDNFFELGGHSLKLVTMMERLRQVGQSVSARSIYEKPTLASLARELLEEPATRFEVPPNLIPPDCCEITPDMLSMLQIEALHIARISASVPGGAKNIQDIYPLAPLQEGVLFHHKLDGHAGDTYVLPMLFEVSSRRRVTDLVCAIQSVIDRHDILRTAILWRNLPRPVQVVYRKAELPVEEFVLKLDADPLDQLNERMRPECQRLELAKAPLMRLQVAQGADERWYCLLQFHHLICDHESLETMIAEVGAYADGKAQSLPAPVPYRVHVAQALENVRTNDAESFFRKKLGEVEDSTIAFGLSDVRGDGSRIDEARRLLDSALTQRIRKQARLLGVTPAILFHAAWALVVAKTSGRDDVVFGTVLLGRLQGEAGALRTLGLFINTLPVRFRLNGVTAGSLIAQVHQELVELLDHEQASLAAAQRCSGIAGSAPLFNTLLNYLHSTLHLETEKTDVASGVQVLASKEWTNYPITLCVDDQGEGFVLTAQTDRSVEPTRVLGFAAEALESLVDALETKPDAPALSLSILPETEWSQVIRSFNATLSDGRHEKLIHELFQEQARRTPDAPAVVQEDRSLSFSQLNVRSNQLARYLREMGVRPDSVVALFVERSIGMLVGLFGVLKAGGAYLPLDPTNPIDRVEQVLSDAAPMIVLTHDALRRSLGRTEAKVIALDAHWNEISKCDQGDLASQLTGLTSRNLAYVIYTSGSTGKPKGVLVEHRSVVNYTDYAIEKFDVTFGEGTLIATSLSFDLGLTGLYSTLLCGRAVRLCSDRDGIPSLVADARRSKNLAPLKLTPSHLPLLEPSLRSGDLAGSIRVLVLGGEPLHSTAVQLWRMYAPGTRIFNHYGPTEATIGCIVNEITSDEAGAIPIGRPISNTQIYVLDRCLQPVPIGVVGEIYIGGVGVARGYLNRPGATSERFVADPFSSSGVRLYRTGDVGRWRIDGAIEYVGRIDHQVKVRGYRVELGEIEAQLLGNPWVQEAAVLVREDVTGEKRLVAYVVGAHKAVVRVSEETPGRLRSDVVTAWESVHEETYRTNPVKGPSYIGWDSSYTGQPIPEVQMQEWLSCTVERIR
ncbi:amino acid adenylation domain-containing protein, partial [Steroidobacter flavus]